MDLDALQIQIESDSNKAAEAINSLISGLENLNNALKGLDVSKITAFTNAVSKLSNIGSTTNTTSKALRGMSNQLSKTFGIKSKDGIKDLNVALNDFYEATKRSSKDSSLPTQQMYVDSAKALHKAITENASYKKELRDDVRIVKDFYDAQKATGSVFYLKGYKDLFDKKTWDEYKQSLGSVFTFKKFSNEQGVGDIENFFAGLHKDLPIKEFFSDRENPLDTAEAIKKLVEYLEEAKNSTLSYAKAQEEQVISGNEAKEGVIAIGEELKALVRQQNEFSGENGLKGVVTAMQALGAVKMPDMTGVADAVKALNANPSTNTAKAVADIGNNASNSAKQVEELTGKLDKVQRVIEGNEVKDYQRGFTMKDAPTTPSVEYPPAVIQTVTEQAQAFQEKLLPAVVDTVNATNELYSSMSNTSAVESAYDALYEKILEIKRAMFEGGATNEKWFVPEQGQNPSFNRESLGFISDIKSSDAQDYFYKIEDTAKGTALAIRDVGTTALASADQFKPVEEAMKNAFDNQKVEEFKNTVDSIPSEPLNDVAESAKKVISPIEQALDTMREMKKLISDMESGKTPFDLGEYQNAIKMYDQASDKVSDFKKKLTEQPKEVGMADVIENLVALGEALEKVSQKFGMLANTGIKLFKGLATPLKWAANEYVEKFENMKANLDGFVKRFQKGMDKISQFWKRTMKTFTFMIVRKVFTAIIKEVGNAVQSLAMWSNAMGTAFNNDISLMVADFQYLGRSIISVFAPLLNTIAPIIDAIVDKIATLISYIGMLFAALGGGTSFTKAKKNVTNYAESLDSASKSAKNLTMGIDELNILNDSKGGGGSKPYDGWEDAWEEVEIPDWITDLSDKIKGIFKDLFSPIKEAWENAKDYVLSGWKYMTEQMKLLLADVWRDFLRVWQSETVVNIFETFFNIIGDMERVIGNLASNFRDAWNDADAGYNILLNLAKVVETLLGHVRNVTEYMIEWSAGVTFYDLVHSVEDLPASFIKLADFLGGVFEDVMKNIVLKYIEWMIEEGIPHFNHMLTDLINSFNFDKIRQDLVPLEESIESLMEKLHTAVTNTIGNLGKQVAEFTNSEKFTLFMERLADIMDRISEKDIEKLLTGIGQGILRIADKLVDFVNSDTFLAFIDKLDKWYDNVSEDDIAGLLEKIAFAIGLFKFAEFTSSGLAGFFSFATILMSLHNLGTISAELGSIATSLEGVGAGGAAAGGGMSAFSSSLGPVALAVGLVVVSIYSIIESFGGLDGTIQEIKRRFDELKAKFNEVKEHIIQFAEKLNISEHVETLKQNFQGVLDALGTLKNYWTMVFDFLQKKIENFMSRMEVIIEVVLILVDAVIQALAGLLKMVEGIILIFSGLTDCIYGVIEVFKGIGLIIKGLVTGDFTTLQEGVATLSDGFFNFGQGVDKIVKGAETAWQGFVETLLGLFDGIMTGFEKLFTGMMESFGGFVGEWGKAIDDWWTNSVAPWFTFEKWAKLGDDLVNGIFGGISRTWESAKDTAGAVGKWILDKFRKDTDSHSPSREADKIGQDVVAGLMLPFTEKNLIQVSKFTTEFLNIFRVGLSPDKFKGIGDGAMDGMLVSISSSFPSFERAIQELFIIITQAIHTNLTVLGTTMIGTMLPEFVNTYLMPFFSQETWQPLFDMLREVFVYQLEDFKTWFTESMSEWWENDLTAIFKAEKWNAEIFTPLSENLKSQFEKFKSWWNKSMNDWWKDKVVFWFKSAKWDEEIYSPLKENLHKHFDNFIEYWDKSMNTWWKDKVLFWFKTLKWDEEIYTPLKDNLHKHWDAFIKWWDESLNKWWDEHVLVWFKDELWDNDIYNPIKENLYGHFESFLRWWDESLDDWWTNHVKPYFEAEKWAEQFDNVHEQADDSFGKVKEVIDECMSNASDAVSEACEGMANSLTKLIELIGNVEMNVKNFGSIGGNVSFNYSGQFASGGFPTMGSLFLAGENGAGAELVGNVGGKTGVVSNGEITGIADAVYATGNQESELLTQLLQVTQSLLDKDPVVIGDRDIAQMAQNGQSQMGMSIIS